MKKLVASLLVASMALGLTACGGSSDSTASTGESTGTAAGTEAAATAEATTTNAETNVLYINLASEPDYLDPALNSSVDGGCLAVNSFAGLYTRRSLVAYEYFQRSSLHYSSSLNFELSLSLSFNYTQDLNLFLLIYNQKILSKNPLPYLL